MLFVLYSDSSKLAIELSAVTSIAWGVDGANVTLSCGHGLNITAEAGDILLETISHMRAAEYAVESSLNVPSGLPDAAKNLDGCDP